MNLTFFNSVEDFLSTTRQALEAKEVVNSLMLGIAENLAKNLHFYGDLNPYLAVVEHKNRQLLRASMTPPYGLLLSFDTVNLSKALPLLVDDLTQRGLSMPDVHAPKPVSFQFAQVWAERTGGRFELEMAQRLYELRAVTPVQGIPGEMVVATEADISLITKWMVAFQIDCFGELELSEERIQKSVTRSVAAGAWYLWKLEGRPVSMAIASRPTQHGISVSGVYTPPEERRQGYASACVAALSQKMLDQGYQFCSLFTDLANPTSNSIYQQVGYRPVSDFDKFKLITP